MERSPVVCSVICEYDPFHNGHRHHLKEARKITGADYIICIMSGPITQRGSFSRYDKTIRAESALRYGADLVLELPVRFACASAEEFAAGGISITSRLGVCTHLAFGCEPALIPLLPQITELCRNESPVFSGLLHDALKAGLAYPAAYAQALAALTQKEDLKTLLASPNAILAIQYLKKLPGNIHPVAIQRLGEYHASDLTAFSSASALRLAAESRHLTPESAGLAMPDPEPYLLAEAEQRIHPADALSQTLLYLLRTSDPDTLARIHGMAEGLHNRFIQCAFEVSSRDALIQRIKTRRFTYARLSRICSCILLGLTADTAHTYASPAYARVLGFRRSAAPLLRAIQSSGTSIPLIQRARDLPRDTIQYRLDHLAQVLWDLGCANPDYAAGNRDLTTPLVIV